MNITVGIDFGTSTTVVRYRKDDSDTVLAVKDKDGVHDIIPTAIYRVEGNDNSLYGYEALAAKEGGVPGTLITNFKMGLLKADAAEQKGYIKEFLCYVYQMFKQEVQGLKYDDLTVYVSYPAKWPDEFINFMSSAVQEAGFKGKVIGIIEPKAATFFMLKRHPEIFENPELVGPDMSLNIFMLDMGAGTTDIVMFRLLLNQDGTLDIDNLRSYPPIDNPYLCGGREIDTILSKHITDYISKMSNIPVMDIFTADNAKQWKDSNLSTTISLNKTAPLPLTLQNVMKMLPNGKDIISGFQMDRQHFESATKDHWNNLENLIEQATSEYSKEYGCGAEDFDLLFLTGGHSQWYKVPEIFTNGNLDFEKFRKEPSRIFGSESHPHESVAIGMCLQDQKIKIKETSPNNIWISVWVDKKVAPFKLVSANDCLPCVKKISPRFNIVREGQLKEQEYHIHIDIYSGSELATARKSCLTQVLENGSLGETLGTTLVCGGLMYLFSPITAIVGSLMSIGKKAFGKDELTIEVPIEVTVNDNNTIDVNGSFLFAEGLNVPTQELSPLKDKDNNTVAFNKDNFAYLEVHDEQYSATGVEKSSFDVILTSAGEYSLRVVKVVKDLCGLSLKEAKELVDTAPKAVKEGVSKEEAEQLKAALVEAGAKVEVK